MEIKELLSPHIECIWNIYRKHKPTNDYNIISVSYFSKKDKTNEKKKRYFQGLQQLYYLMRRLLPNFILRVYCDSSVISNMVLFYNSVKKNYIELFHYDIKYLYEPNNNEYHKGTIGTLWRFLPLFKSHIHSCNKKLVLDIDTIYNDLFLKLIQKIEKTDVHLMYRSHPYYYQIQRINCAESDIKFEYLVAHFIYQTNEIDYDIFPEFLERYFVNITDIDRKKIVEKCKMISEFEYGIDEIFMNEYFLTKHYKLLKNKDNKYNIYICYHISNYDYKYILIDFLNEIQLKYLNIKKDDFDKINLFFMKLFKKIELIKPLETYKIIENNRFNIKKFIDFINNYKSNDSTYFYDNLLIPTFKNNIFNKKIAIIFKKYFKFYFIDKKLQRLNYIISLYRENHFLILEKTILKYKIKYYPY